MKNIALILASGSGSRCGLDYPKQFAEIEDKTILELSVDAFEHNSLIDEIIVVTNLDYISKVKVMTEKYSKVSKVVAGGETRRESSYNGIFSIDEDEANVLIHDAARPLVTDKIIADCILGLHRYKAVCTAINSTDTIFLIDSDKNITDIPKRTYCRRAQTPQCFKLSLIKEAHSRAQGDINCSVTDDCGLILEYTDENIHIIEGDEDNIKVTYKDDIDFVRRRLRK